MTVIGAVKKSSKMPYYKDDGQTEDEHEQGQPFLFPNPGDNRMQPGPGMYDQVPPGAVMHQHPVGPRMMNGPGPGMNGPPQGYPVQRNGRPGMPGMGPPLNGGASPGRVLGHAPPGHPIAGRMPPPMMNMGPGPPQHMNDQRMVGMEGRPTGGPPGGPNGIPGGPRGQQHGMVGSRMPQGMPQGMPGMGYSGSPATGLGGMGGMKPMGMGMEDFPGLGGDHFPSLGSRPPSSTTPMANQLQGGGLGMGGVGGMNYAVTKKSPKQQEFNMSEDMFPALPTAKGGGGLGSVGSVGGAKPSPSEAPRSPGGTVLASSPPQRGGRPPGPPGHFAQGQKVPLSPGGTSGGPGGMGAQQAAASRGGAMAGEVLDASDRYGLLGLLQLIRMSDQDLKTLALGTDLTLLGLNLNSPDVLFPSFQSPWAEAPMRPKEPAYNLPACYKITASLPPVPHRMAPGQPQLSDETLFYTFYSMPGDINQLAAAAALYEHGWRYHKEQKVWITRSPGVEPSVRTGTYEEGTYIYFDIREWKKITKVFHLQYDQLEERKSTPAAPPGP